MSIELVRDTINYEKLVGEGTGQMMVNGDIILGERSSEIVSILNMDGKVIVSNAECVEDKIIIEGKMQFELIYASDDEKGNLYKVNAASNFTHNIQIPNTKSQMPCKIETRIDHIDFDQITSRKIKVNAIININGMVYEKSNIEAVIDIKAQDIQVLKSPIMVDEFISENSGQSIVRAKFKTEKGNINSILKREVFIHKKEVYIEEGKIIINACGRIQLLYDDEEGEVVSIEQDAPFTAELNIPDIRSNMKCDVVFKVGEAYDEIKEDENGNKVIIESEIIVEFIGKAYGKREIENVVDAYSLSQRYEMDKETVRGISYFGEGAGSDAIKERIAIPEDVKVIGKMKNLMAKPIVTEVKAIEDKIIIEGIVNCCLIYDAATEEGGTVSYEEEIPFKTAIDMLGIKIDMLPEVEVNTCDVGFDLVSDKNVDVKMLVISTAKAYMKTTCDISKNATETELPESLKNMPSIIIYNVQNNDTLWKIAKKYSTTIEDIVALNDFENPEMLEVGTKLLIPKKLFMKQ